MSMLKHSLLFTAATVLGTGWLPADERRAPNLIVIVSDDQGYRDVGFNGGTDIPTPNLDRLAKGGVVFTDAYVTGAVCGPSRAGLITGRYPQRFGFGKTPAYRPGDPQEGLSTREQTLAEALRAHGYTSAAIGKWHLGAHDVFHPLHRGFDEFFGHLGGGKRFFPELLTRRTTTDARNEWESYHTWISRGFEPFRTTGYLTEEFNREALDFVRRRAATPEKPFFLYLAYNAPHAPFEAPEEEIAKFAHLQPEERRSYAGMIAVMDRGVGQVLDLLDEKGLADNTLIFFLSDNGGPTNKNITDNAPLRAGKASPYEGGFRVPMAARWPGVIPAGLRYAQPVSALDIFATIAALNRIPENPDRPLDGVNLIPFLTGQKQGPPHEHICLRMDGSPTRFSLREGDYKIVSVDGNAVELYNLRDDVSEKRDLAASDPALRDRLLAAYRAWDRELLANTLAGLPPEAWGGKSKAAKPPGEGRKPGTE
jgi:arylsulfatase A-like enzyme